jgi:hypothetical protein
MKIAPLGFLAAVGIFLVTMAVSQRQSQPDQAIRKILDVEGVDTVVVKSNRELDITIDDTKKFELYYDSYDYSEDTDIAPKLLVTKEDNRLFINADVRSYGELEISLPSSIRYLQLSDASITSTETLDALDVQMNEGSLRWKGNATLLNINNVGEDGCDLSDCGREINIISGIIEQLHIQALAGAVALDKSSDLKAIRLSLGPEVRLTVSHPASIKTIQLENYIEKSAVGVTTEK